jgi:hypothetical protein
MVTEAKRPTPACDNSMHLDKPDGVLRGNCRNIFAAPARALSCPRLALRSRLEGHVGRTIAEATGSGMAERKTLSGS